MSTVSPFRTTPKTLDEVRKILQQLRQLVNNDLGTMAQQNADNVNIDGGNISGTTVNMQGASLLLDEDQIGIEYIGTTEESTALVLAPDGEGGVEWVAPSSGAGGGGSSWNTYLALIGLGGI